MSRLTTLFKGASALIDARKAQLRLALRVTISVVLTFFVGQFLQLPLGGLWAVLTSVVVTQMSVGGSLKAAVEYSVGTLGGAIYAGAIATLVPHSSELAYLGVLGLAVAPLALLAAINPNFRIGPFTGVLVVLGGMATHAGPIVSAFYRVFEVAIGAAVALLVSFLVLPARANVMANEAAAQTVDIMARALPELLAGFTRSVERAEILRAQRRIGAALAQFNAIAPEARHERMARFADPLDHDALARTLLRLRHDLIMIGRAAATPLPEAPRERLAPLLARVAAAASDYLRAVSAALIERKCAPPRGAANAAFDDFAAEIGALRRDGVARGLSSDEVEQLFALGFALEQMRQNFADLSARVAECAQ